MTENDQGAGSTKNYTVVEAVCVDRRRQGLGERVRPVVQHRTSALGDRLPSIAAGLNIPIETQDADPVFELLPGSAVAVSDDRRNAIA